ncbi:hypothetical protein [Flavobacterium sp. GCM10027622]|uniref:hypothetical protein n=1 Tax=unclassified Flavobacterium TaxID=196869 RepID=UPI00361725F6
MRKKLEAELISIAHRILKMKHKDDVRELHHETQKLYEKLSVLLFVEENFDEVKPTIGIHDIEDRLERAFDFDEKIVVAELKEDDTIEIKTEEKAVEEKIEATKEVEEVTEVKIEEITAADTKIESTKEEVINPEVKEIKEANVEETTKEDKKHFLFDDILSDLQPEPVFERVDNNKLPNEIAKIIETKVEETKKTETEIFVAAEEPIFEKAEKSKPGSNLNDKLNKGINITLNDRIAFEKNLFDGSTADLNRVISQISTFDTFEDAKNFIDEMVRPDYNDWKGKEEFAERFMEFVESKFA